MKFQGAYTFDGDNDIITIADAGDILNFTTNFSVLFWGKLDANEETYQFAVSNWDYLLGTRDQNGWLVGFTNGILRFQGVKDSVSSWDVSGGGDLRGDGLWHLCGCVKEGTGAGSARVYVDGNEVKTGTATANAGYNGANQGKRIGCRWNAENNQSFYDGYLDEIVTFNRALTAAEMRKWYAWATGKLV